MMDIGRTLQNIEARLARMERSARLSHAAIDDTAVEVRDASGNLRGLLGVQADGTTAVNIVNGPAPATPSTPTVAPALGGVAVGWDGTFADGSVPPLDWSRVEVHAAATPGFTAGPDTLQGTIETPQGGILYVPATAPTYVQLLARNTSGTGSTATPEVGPYAPRPVAGDIGIGEITETLIADNAVTTPKIFANAVTTAKLAAGSVDATAIAADAITGKTITGGTITGSVLQTAASGQRITLNESSANKVLVYNSSGVIVGELSSSGLLVKGTNGSVLWLDPNHAFPNLRLTNAGQTNSAVINVSENTAGAADIGMNSGLFTGSSFSDMKWRTFFGNDFWVAERMRDSNVATNIGGRIFLANDRVTIGYNDSTGATPAALLHIFSLFAQLNGARLEVIPPASSNSALYVNADTAHTGNLLRLRLGSTDKLTVDKDGKLNATNIAAGQVIITPSAANTPTSLNVTGLNLTGTVRVVAVANSSVVGTQITGVGVTGATSTGFTLWVTRTNTSATGINWIAIGE